MDVSEFIEIINEDLLKKTIKSGDIIYVASDMVGVFSAAKSCGVQTGKKERELICDELINSLIELVGQNGTVLIPVFSWDYCKGIPFDYRHSKGKTGILGNYILNCRNDFRRTRHPIYSFMVWGKYSDLLVSFNNQDSWGKDSPFEFLYGNHAKQLNINVTMNHCLTMVHYVEQKLNVPYRYEKHFINYYIGLDGKKVRGDYSMFVRNLDYHFKTALPESFFEYKLFYKKYEGHGLFVSVSDIEKVCDVLEEDLKNNRKHWLIFPEGTRNKDDRELLLEFHHGTFRPAMKAGVPIVPVAIFGTQRIFDKKSKFRKYPVQVIFGKPIYPEEYQNMKTEEVAQLVQSRIQSLLTYKARKYDRGILKEKLGDNFKENL